MSNKRSRKVAERMQRNAEQQDTRQPTRRPTSSYVKRLMMEYHDRHVLPLAADARVSGQLLAALTKTMLDKGYITEQELSDAIVHNGQAGTAPPDNGPAPALTPASEMAAPVGEPKPGSAGTAVESGHRTAGGSGSIEAIPNGDEP